VIPCPRSAPEVILDRYLERHLAHLAD